MSVIALTFFFFFFLTISCQYEQLHILCMAYCRKVCSFRYTFTYDTVAAMTKISNAFKEFLIRVEGKLIRWEWSWKNTLLVMEWVEVTTKYPANKNVCQILKSVSRNNLDFYRAILSHYYFSAWLNTRGETNNKQRPNNLNRQLAGAKTLFIYIYT